MKWWYHVPQMVNTLLARVSFSWKLKVFELEASPGDQSVWPQTNVQMLLLGATKVNNTVSKRFHFPTCLRFKWNNLPNWKWLYPRIKYLHFLPNDTDNCPRRGDYKLHVQSEIPERESTGLRTLAIPMSRSSKEKARWVKNQRSKEQDLLTTMPNLFPQRQEAEQRQERLALGQWSICLF